MYTDYFELGDVTIKLNMPFPLVSYNKLLSKYNVGSHGKIDAEYDVKIAENEKIDAFLSDLGAPVYEQINVKVYKKDESYIRVFSLWKDRRECRALLFEREKHKYELLCESDAARIIENSYRIINMIGIEELLLSFNALILHSVVIDHNGKAVLFTAPSGTGKTTHASLWQKLYGAEIINGDRGIIKKINGVYCACGSPYSGTSGENQNIYRPISAIVVLSQSKDNKVNELSNTAKFKALYTESTVNSWSETYLNKLSALIEDIIMNVKTVNLSCNMEDEAAEILHEYIFG